MVMMNPVRTGGGPRMKREPRMDTNKHGYLKNIFSHLCSSVCICGFMLAGGNGE